MIDLIHGDARAVVRLLDTNLVDAVVTDPPYEIDYARQLRSLHGGHDWDRTGIAFDPAFWAEVHRVLKPGGNLLAFAAPRTSHRIASAIEDGGFEIRDQILVWLKSYGFPKRLPFERKLTKLGREDLHPHVAGIGNMLKPSYEPIIVARKPPLHGDLVENIAEFGVGGYGIDACRITTTDDRSRKPGSSQRGDMLWMSRGSEKSTSHPEGRYPGNFLLAHDPHCREGASCVESCHVLELGEVRSRPAEFFPTFHYSGRASRSERPVVDGIEHPTVKPLSLMRWLVRLAAPHPGAVILDPFAGTGTTGEAAREEGAGCILVEADNAYVRLAEERLSRAAAHTIDIR